MTLQRRAPIAMEHIFWLVPDKLAGRPGPNLHPWNHSEISAAGFGAVLSLNDGSSCQPEEFAKYGIHYACVPLPPNAPPEPGDDTICIEGLSKAYSFVIAHLHDDRRVLVHCTSGKDRTGLFLAYFLIQKEQISPPEAIARVRQVRTTALTAEGWEELAEQVLDYLR
jgi:protein-tyrosine phosphatase